MTKSQSIGRGAFFIVASELSFAFSAAIIKLVSDSLPNESIVFFRNFFGLVILTPLLLKTDTPILHTNRFHLHLLRSGIGIGAILTLHLEFFNSRNAIEEMGLIN